MKKYLLLAFLFVSTSAFAQEIDQVCLKEVQSEVIDLAKELLGGLQQYGNRDQNDFLPMCDDVVALNQVVDQKIRTNYKKKCNDAKLPDFHELTSFSVTAYGMAGNTLITLWNRTKAAYTNMPLDVLDQDMMLLFDEVYVPSTIRVRYPDAFEAIAPACWAKFKSTVSKSLSEKDALTIVKYGSPESNFMIGMSNSFTLATFTDSKKLEWTKVQDLNVNQKLIDATGSPVSILDIHTNNLTDKKNISMRESSAQRLKIYNVLNNMGAFYAGDKSHRVLVNGVNQ